MIGPRHRLVSAVIGVLSFLAAGCAGGDAESGEDEGGGVRTVDAAAAAGNRPGAGSADRGEDASDVPAGDVSTDGAVPTSAPPTSAPTTTGYPEITDSIRPAEGGVRGLLSPTGVVLAVTGEVDGGYVVDTPCGGVTIVTRGEPITDVTVVLDPGHGGDEPGAIGLSGLTEADLNLALARATTSELIDRSISVVLTRNADYRIPIRGRAALADALAPELFVSIHHNTPASRPSPQPGTEVYVQSSSEPSRRLGGLLYEEVFGALSQFDVEWTSRDDAGVLVVLNDADEDAYGIARYPTTTSALVEMAYLGNEFEEALLTGDEYLTVGAKALADGIERFLASEDPGSGFVETPRRFNPSGATGGSEGCVDPVLE